MPPLFCRSIGVTAIAVAFGITLSATCKPFPIAGKVPIAAFCATGLIKGNANGVVAKPAPTRNKLATPSAPPDPPPCPGKILLNCSLIFMFSDLFKNLFFSGNRSSNFCNASCVTSSCCLFKALKRLCFLLIFFQGFP